MHIYLHGTKIHRIFTESIRHNNKTKTMTTTEIYNLAAELTDQQVNNILGSWEQTNETKSIEMFNRLVRLGDSECLAMATVLSEKTKEESDMYYQAYCL